METGSIVCPARSYSSAIFLPDQLTLSALHCRCYVLTSPELSLSVLYFDPYFGIIVGRTWWHVCDVHPFPALQPSLIVPSSFGIYARSKLWSVWPSWNLVGSTLIYVSKTWLKLGWLVIQSFKTASLDSTPSKHLQHSTEPTLKKTKKKTQHPQKIQKKKTPH